MKREFKVRLTPRGPGGAWTFMTVPFDVAEAFGTKGRVPVRGTMNGFAFRNSLMPEGDGRHAMMVNKELQKGAGAKAGDTVAVVLEKDDAERTVTVPEDLRAALAAHKDLPDVFAKLSYSIRKEFVEWIESAKKQETRDKRVQTALEMLGSGKRPKG